MTKEFDLKVLKIVVGSKKFLLILDDIREEENHDISKREDVFAPSILTYWILVTARIDLLTSTTQTTHKRTKMMNQVVRGLVARISRQNTNDARRYPNDVRSTNGLRQCVRIAVNTLNALPICSVKVVHANRGSQAYKMAVKTDSKQGKDSNQINVHLMCYLVLVPLWPVAAYFGGRGNESNKEASPYYHASSLFYNEHIVVGSTKCENTAPNASLMTMFKHHRNLPTKVLQKEDQ
ncbi:hypothetical protein IEQ34_000772 [Dendrobium chrysotoxum]|uniref:Uncharacterized protein n=1 Tax=Dendrobium chrysotoxum TaxID=161865 RepID=A0AAV7HTC2_DENCH|nr:hypothetical protein IEQ34_000772 [Dendrobium chrysotoxum]